MSIDGVDQQVMKLCTPKINQFVGGTHPMLKDRSCVATELDEHRFTLEKRIQIVPGLARHSRELEVGRDVVRFDAKSIIAAARRITNVDVV